MENVLNISLGFDCSAEVVPQSEVFHQAVPANDYFRQSLKRYIRLRQEPKPNGLICSAEALPQSEVFHQAVPANHYFRQSLSLTVLAQQKTLPFFTTKITLQYETKIRKYTRIKN